MDPIDNVEDMSERMHLYPTEEYITGPLIQTEFNEQVSPLLLLVPYKS